MRITLPPYCIPPPDGRASRISRPAGPTPARPPLTQSRNARAVATGSTPRRRGGQIRPNPNCSARDACAAGGLLGFRRRFCPGGDFALGAVLGSPRPLCCGEKQREQAVRRLDSLHSGAERCSGAWRCGCVL
jgi:hypothetical protein